MNWFRKAIAGVLIGIILTLQPLGCSTIPKEERAYIGTLDYQYASLEIETNARLPAVGISAVDNEEWNFKPIRQGPHTVRVVVEWSNGFHDETDLAFEAVAGKRYMVYAIELNPGQDSCTVTVNSRSFAKQLAMQMGGQVVLYTVGTFFFPFVIAHMIDEEELKKQSKARPFEGCCYIWIEDKDSREMVAGNKLGVTEGKGGLVIP